MFFERLLVVRDVGRDIRGAVLWECICSCEGNNIVIATGSRLKSGSVKSCGCYRKEYMSQSKKKFNTFDLSGDFGIGYTSNNSSYYFDLEDYPLIKDVSWCISSRGYVIYQSISMHRSILRLQSNDKVFVDHRNGIKIDNRKSNLRICTKSQNAMNQVLRSDNKSGVTGVRFDKQQKKWAASITINGKRTRLGFYEKIEDAIISRKEAEEKYFGEFSIQNSRGDLDVCKSS